MPTDLTPTTNPPIVGDRRTVRFPLADASGTPLSADLAKCTLTQKDGSGTVTDATASLALSANATTGVNDAAITVDLDEPGEWRWRLVYDDSSAGFVEAVEAELYVERRTVGSP